MLTNQALRQKIKPSNSIEENAELIKAEVLKKFEEAQKALAKEKETSGNLESELIQVNTKLELMNSRLELISKKYIDETEEIIKRKQKENIEAIEAKKNNVQEKIDSISLRLDDILELKRKAEKEINQQMSSFSGKLNCFFRDSDNYRKQLEDKIIPKYFECSKYLELQTKKELLVKKLESFESYQVEEKVIIFCENKNSEILNKLGFRNITFLSEKNSNGVFIKVKANPDKFGVRDRDYLIDTEIKKLQKQYTNYFILEYYCFENYLFHPRT